MKTINNTGQLSKLVLPVRLHNEITTYFYHYLYLAVILCHEELLPWFYSHFIQVYSYISWEHKENWLLLDYEWQPYNKLFTKVQWDFSAIADQDNIARFLTELLAAGKYIYIYFDEYYLPGKPSYRQRHYIHESLVYGYADREQSFMALGFDKEYKLSALQFSPADINTAFTGTGQYYPQLACWVAGRAVSAFALKTDLTCEVFDEERFCTQLADYTRPRDDKMYNHPLREGEEKVRSAGLALYDVVRMSLEEELENMTLLDYRAFHLLYEHKRGLGKRLKFYAGRKGAGNAEYAGLLAEWEKLVLDFDGIRKLYLKQALCESAFTNPYQVVGDSGTRSRITAKLGLLKERERQLLEDIGAVLITGKSR